MQVRASFAATPPPLEASYSAPAWQAAPVHTVGHLWHGAAAPAALWTTARLLWTPSHLWVGFECGYTELDSDDVADTSVERPALWERDVCEAFIAGPREPDAASYKEFEVAPTGQWCDLAIRRPRVDVDWAWQGGMETAAAIDHDARVWRAVMRLPFTAFGGAPSAGERWRINLFRIGRLGGERQYLALAPTGTRTPDFHVPACFVPLVFDEAPAGVA